MSRRIVILDDDEDIVSLCTHILSKMGYEVHNCNYCNNLIYNLESIKPSVIFVDNSIGNGDGVVTTQRIKAHHPLRDTPIIYFSAHHQIKMLAEEAGADGYLEKPFIIKDLEKIVNAVTRNLNNDTDKRNTN